MSQTVELPIWFFVLIVLFAAVTFASHFLFPSVRWFFRRRLERAVAKLNTRLERPIEPFKLARRTDMIQRLIYDPQVSEAIVDHARRNSVREDVAFEQARRYAREIVPSFSAFAYFGFGIRAARRLANALYDVRTAPSNDQVIANLSKEATVIFVMNHRSNMDYVLVTYLAARASALSYAVGEWARIWPLSRLIKSMGAYFIRRKSRNALYRRVLARYVQMATEGGVTQAIFPEGGLSLDGRLARPKMGLLSYVIDGYNSDTRDVVFVPVAISYDRVLEDRVLIAAHKRGDRRFGAKISVVVGFILRKLWLRLRGKFLRFGAAGVAFGEPLSLRAFGPDRGLDDLANALMERIHDAMPQLAVPLLARSLLLKSEPRSKAEILDSADTSGILLSDDLNAAQALEAAFANLTNRQLLSEADGLWSINPECRDVLAYYANATGLEHFAISASAK